MKSKIDQKQSNEILAALEAAAAMPPEGHDDEWLQIARDIKIQPRLIPAVREALSQGRWRTVKNPIAYIRVVANREAVRMGLVEKAEKNLGLNLPIINGVEAGHDDYIDHQSFSGPVKENGVWRNGASDDTYDSDDYDEEGVRLTRRERLVNRLPDELKSTKLNLIVGDGPNRLGSVTGPDWEKMAQISGLDDGEKLVFSFRARGISRERAIEMQETEAQKRAVQASWRRFERSGLAKLRKYCMNAKKVA